MYNLLIGGAAGQGIDTTAAILEKLLKRTGYHVFTVRDFMSRVRGGHNFSLIRFGTEAVISHSYDLDCIIALNEETIRLHSAQLNPKGFILCDSSISTDEPRAIKINMNEIAESIGNKNVSGSIAIGAILRLFGEELLDANDVIKTFVKEQYVGVNLKAMETGYGLVEKRFPHLNGGFDRHLILSGSKALALGAIAAGLKFYSAYPMSPSTTIMEYLASKGAEANIVVEQAEDEIAAINMAIGASYAGARAMVGTSGGGFSLMVEGLGLSGMAEIPLVIVDAQRPGPVTGFPTRTEQSDLRFVISASQGEFPRMVIAPRHHADLFYQTVRAFRLAEKYQLPVIILGDQYLFDATATVEPFHLDNPEIAYPAAAHDHDEKYLRYKLTEDGISPRLMPGKTNHLVIIDSDEHDEMGWITESAQMRTLMMNKRMKKRDKLALELQEPEFIGPEEFEILLLGWGSTYGPIAEAIAILNQSQKASYAALVFGDIDPLPTKRLKEKSLAAHTIINIEQNATGQLAGLIREKTGILCSDSVLKYDGRQISGEEIAGVLMGREQK